LGLNVTGVWCFFKGVWGCHLLNFKIQDILLGVTNEIGKETTRGDMHVWKLQNRPTPTR